MPRNPEIAARREAIGPVTDSIPTTTMQEIVQIAREHWGPVVPSRPALAMRIDRAAKRVRACRNELAAAMAEFRAADDDLRSSLDAPTFGETFGPVEP